MVSGGCRIFKKGLIPIEQKSAELADLLKMLRQLNEALIKTKELQATKDSCIMHIAR